MSFLLLLYKVVKTDEFWGSCPPCLPPKILMLALSLNGTLPKSPNCWFWFWLYCSYLQGHYCFYCKLKKKLELTHSKNHQFSPILNCNNMVILVDFLHFVIFCPSFFSIFFRLAFLGPLHPCICPCTFNTFKSEILTNLMNILWSAASSTLLNMMNTVAFGLVLLNHCLSHFLWKWSIWANVTTKVCIKKFRKISIN